MFGFTKDDVKRVAWTFAQAFLAVFLVLAAGIMKAPNMVEAKALFIAALAASVAAGFSAVKNWFANRVRKPGLK